MPNLRNTRTFREELLAALGVTDDLDVENENNFKSALLDALNVDHIPQDVSNFEKFREKLIEAADGIGSGGGGESDFSTAEVTATYTLPEGVNSAEELEFSTSFFSIIKAEDNEYHDQGANFAYGGKYLPLSLLGTVSEINVPLLADDGYFTDMCGVQFKLSDETIFVVDISNSSVVSGDAEIDAVNGFIKVTGDCVLNLALANN